MLRLLAIVSCIGCVPTNESTITDSLHSGSEVVAQATKRKEKEKEKEEGSSESDKSIEVTVTLTLIKAMTNDVRVALAHFPLLPRGVYILLHIFSNT